MKRDSTGFIVGPVNSTLHAVAQAWSASMVIRSRGAREKKPRGIAFADVTLEGLGQLYVGDRPACTVRYRLLGWDTGGRMTRTGPSVEVRGSLRRLERVTCFEFVGRDDVSLDLRRDDLWWNCRILTIWGDAVARDGALHWRST
jgi:hypothetical protein